jgi:hypothetical protein
LLPADDCGCGHSLCTCSVYGHTMQEHRSTKVFSVKSYFHRFVKVFSLENFPLYGINRCHICSMLHAAITI